MHIVCMYLYIIWSLCSVLLENIFLKIDLFSFVWLWPWKWATKHLQWFFFFFIAFEKWIFFFLPKQTEKCVELLSIWYFWYLQLIILNLRNCLYLCASLVYYCSFSYRQVLFLLTEFDLNYAWIKCLEEAFFGAIVWLLRRSKLYWDQMMTVGKLRQIVS